MKRLLIAASLLLSAPAFGQDLAVADPPPDVGLAMAVWEAKLGRLGAAEARLDALLASGPDAEIAARIETEKKRVTAFRELRDTYLRYLHENGKKLTHEHEGKKVKLVIASIADGELAFEKNRSKIERLAVEDLDPGVLAAQMGKKGDELSGKGKWVRLYAYVLTGDQKWKKLLKGDDPDTASLRSDAENDYAGRLVTGRCAFELNALAALPAPTDSTAAGALLARIEAIQRDGRSLPVVQERRDALRELARGAHGVRFDAQGLDLALKGKVTELGDDRIQVFYTFDDPAELEDFRPINEYVKTHRRIQPKLVQEHPNEFTIKDGTLRTIGATVLHHALEFEAPMSLTYDVTAEPSVSGGDDLPLVFNGAICDDGKYSFAWVYNLGDLEVWNDRDVVQDRLKERMIEMGRTYTMKVLHDGKEMVEVHRDGEKMTEAKCTHVRRGRVFFWVHSEMLIHFREVTIEGKVDPEVRQALKAEWVEAQLAGF